MSALADKPLIPFRAAMETRDRRAIVDAFASDAICRSPISPKLVFQGHHEIDALYEAILAVFDDIDYTVELRDGEVGVLVMDARIRGVPIQVVEHVHLTDDDKIREITAFFRPLPALALAAQGLGREIGRRRSPFRARVISLLVSALVLMSRIGDATIVGLVRSSI
jgi:hypothetical protein